MRESLSAEARCPELVRRALIRSAASRLELCAAKGAGDESVARNLYGDRLVPEFDYHVRQGLLVVRRLLLVVRDDLDVPCGVPRWIFVYAPLARLEASVRRLHLFELALRMCLNSHHDLV